MHTHCIGTQCTSLAFMGGKCSCGQYILVRREQGTVHEYNVEWVKVPSAGTVPGRAGVYKLTGVRRSVSASPICCALHPLLCTRTFVYCTGARVSPETQFVRFRKIRNFGEIHHCFRYNFNDSREKKLSFKI